MVFFEKCDFWLIEEEPFLLERDALDMFALYVMDTSDIIRKQLFLQLFLLELSPLSIFLLYLGETSLVVSLGVVSVGVQRLLGLVDLYEISFITINE